MPHTFDRDYWDQHWDGDRAVAPAAMAASPPSPHLIREADSLLPGTALDAGCGAGAEAIWLASRGWQVTAAELDDPGRRAVLLSRIDDREFVDAGHDLPDVVAP